MGFHGEGRKSCSELEVQYGWNRIKPGTSFLCTDGAVVRVLYPGRWNFEAGPDFLNARIEIGGKALSGDIEIHNTPSDWFLHGHDNDEKYSNVVLHVVRFSSEPSLAASNSPDIPTMIFPDSCFLDLPCCANANNMVRYSKGLCSNSLMKLENTKLSRFLCSLGENRLHKKTIIFINEILTSGAYVSFLTTLFEAFGYKNNRQPFINLCKRFLSYKEIVCTDLEFEAIIWGESGLLPSKGLLDSSNEISSYVSCLWKYWWRIKKDIANIPEVVWSKSAIRPSNTPWRRVAGLIVLFRKIGFSPLTYLLSLFKRSLPVKEIVDELIRLFSCGDEIFGAYLNFNTKLKSVSFLIGRARAIEVIGNVIIPFFYAYSKIVKDDGLGKYMFEIWKGLPLSRSNNIALRISFERWGIPKGVVNSFSAEQGVVFIYKNLCEYFQMNCEECLIYNSLKSLNPEI